LRECYQVGKIVVHPTDPNTVYVGTLGRLYGPNPERGVFKTTDGGNSWEKVLFVDDKTGCIDLRMNPADPDMLIAAMWEHKRDEFDSFLGDAKPPPGTDGYGPSVNHGKGGGLFRTTDGGKTWHKLDKGLPTVATGRIGLDWYRKDPKVVFAIVDTEKAGSGNPPPPTPFLGVRGEDQEGGVKVTFVMENSSAAKGGLQPEDVITAMDGKPVESFEKMTDAITEHRKVGDKVKFTVQRGGSTKDITVTLETRPAGQFGGGRGGRGGGTGGGAAQPPAAYLGVQGADEEGGVKVVQAVENGPAAKAGLKKDDVITELDGKAVETNAKLLDALREKKVGDKVKFTVKRGDETKDVTVTLEARPPQTAGGRGTGGGGRGTGRGGAGAGISPDQPWPGFFARDSEDGIRVRAVTEGGSAAKAGIKPDDMVQEVDGKKVNTFRGLLEILRQKKVGDKVKLTVQRGPDKKTVEVALEQFRPPAGGFAGGGPGQAGASPDRPYSSGLGGQVENAQNRQGPEGNQTGGVYKSTDGGETWTRINSVNPRPMYFSQVRVDPSDDKHLYVLGVSFYASHDGGKTFRVDRQANGGVHSDQHCLWVNPKDGRHMLIGTDGGFYVTYDRMKAWEHLTLAALGQFYHVALDNRKPYRVYGGLQDNGSWGGPSRTLRQSGPINEDWFMVGGGDGFVCRVDPDDPDLVYSESQDGNVRRRNLRTGEGGAIRPRGTGGRRGGGEASTEAGSAPTPAPSGSATPQRAQTTTQHRFNWNTPFILSAHNPGIVYVGAEVVFRSLKHGDDLKAISPEITRTKRGSATALAESPRNPDVLWAGTDDGALWVTRDGGREWKRVDEKVGLPGPRWVSTIEASRFAEGRAYVCFDAHRSDDDKPYVYVTEDYGQTWKPLMANLPPFGSTRCLREDVQNQNLLFCGTEFAVFASINRGGYWTKINSNLPTVAVHELAIHPTSGEMVAATHGRSLWIVDVSALRQMTPAVVKAPAHLYAPAAVTQWRREPDVGSMYGNGSKKFFGQNPPRGAAIYYSLTKKPEKIGLKVVDYAGQTVRELAVKSDPGLHKVQWDLRRPSTRTIRDLIGGQADPEQVVRRGGLFTTDVPPGQYRLVLTVDGKEQTQPLRIEADPTGVSNAIAADGDDGDDPDRNMDRDP
ncbi:MAG TPA: PDZ domain-containing protein, partial [Gemmataceae bacterium]